MQMITGDQLAVLLDRRDLVEALRAAFAGDITVPLRHHHPIPRDAGETAMLLLMPAWHGTATNGFIGIKLVSVFPGNTARGKDTVSGSYLLLDGTNGEVLAILDGRMLTLLRTAAASALAASYLAHPDASRLVMVGSGALAPHLIAAHAAVRPIREARIWNRDPAKAAAVAARLSDEPSLAGISIMPVDDLAAAIGEADIVSAATLSTEPLIRGEWLKSGAHVDLVGGFTPAMREADDDCIRRARVFVDTRSGALAEAGDITQPVASGILKPQDIAADLFDLCGGRHQGRQAAGEITFFKSVGTALEDLAAAALAYRRANA